MDDDIPLHYRPPYLTPGGLVAADADVDAVLASGTDRTWAAIWATYQQRTFLQAMYDGSYDNTRDRNEYSAEMAELAPVTALQALAAYARLSQCLCRDRWTTIRNAREAGAGWSDVAEALGLSVDEVREEYERDIADREQRLPDRPEPGGPIPLNWHDTERARAVLADPPTTDRRSDHPS